MAEMKTIEIQHGSSKKSYAEVGERVKAFREKYGDSGQLITSIITNDSEKIVTQTQAIVNGVCLGTGLAEEIRGSTQVNKSSALENCETSSMGRAMSPPLRASRMDGRHWWMADGWLLAAQKSLAACPCPTQSRWPPMRCSLAPMCRSRPTRA